VDIRTLHLSNVSARRASGRSCVDDKRSWSLRDDDDARRKSASFNSSAEHGIRRSVCPQTLPFRTSVALSACSRFVTKLRAHLVFFTQLRVFVYTWFSKPGTTRPGRQHSEKERERTGDRGWIQFNSLIREFCARKLSRVWATLISLGVRKRICSRQAVSFLNPCSEWQRNFDLRNLETNLRAPKQGVEVHRNGMNSYRKHTVSQLQSPNGYCCL
jgi:hypothetical protein